MSRGIGPTIFQTTDYEMLAGCGWDAKSREMRRREPPTRATPYPMPSPWENGKRFTPPEPTRRLNRRNGWHMEGDSKTLVAPQEAAVWLWWLSLGDDAQDEVYELSAKCGDKGDGISHADPDPVAMLADGKAGNKKISRDGDDPREWGRVG